MTKKVKKRPEVKPDDAKKPAEKKTASKDQKSSAAPEKDNAEPKTESPETDGDQPLMSEAQKRAIYNLSRRRGISVDELEKMATETYGTPLEELSSKEASAFIRNLQQAA